MKRSVLTAVLMVFFVGAFAQPGVLDQTFGKNGKVTIPVPLGAAVHPVDIKIQPDQKILVLTRVDTIALRVMSQGDDYCWMYKLLRFKQDGTPDSSFAVNGSTPVVYNERPASMELLANGQILLNTARQSPGNPPYGFWGWVDLCLTRYNSNGSIDNTFGANGRTITRIDTSISIAMSMFVLPSGKIIQAGAAYIPYQSITTSYNILVGYDQNGSIDPTFGNNGKVKVATNRNYGNYYLPFLAPLTIPQTFVILANQKIVVTSDSGLYRFNSNGSLDATFGTNGFSGNPYSYSSIAGFAEPNDKMVFVMRVAPAPPIPSNQTPLKAFRLNYDGSLDTTFNSLVDEDFAGATSHGEQFCKIFLEPNTQYSLAIGVYGNSTIGPSFLAKINSNGSMDSTYGKRGKISFYTTYPKNAFRMNGNAAALQPDGKMVVGGVADTSTNIGYRQNGWVIARYEKNAKVKYNTLVSDVFYDENANGIKDGNEGSFNGIHSMTSTKPGIDTIHWYSQQLVYQADKQDIDTGTYRTSVDINSTYNLPYYTVVPATKTTSHNTYWNTDTLSFAVQKLANVRDLSVTIVRLNTAKPGFPLHYLLKVHNAGTDSAGNIVVKLVKSNKMVYDSATILPASVAADIITWNIAGLQSQHDAFIIVHGKVKAPPAANVGDTMQAIATVTSNKSDTTAADNTSTMTHYVFGAYDPNDKSENHGGKITHTKAISGEYLTYAIRFQNTGNDTAFNVYIRDTMDNKLDWNSLQIVASSHNYQMTMNDGKCLFTFPFIMLVDSIKNELKSHGYIVYKIKAKPNVQIGDVIKNTAAIYFDYNLPIFTNTEMTTVVAEAFPLHLLSFTAKKNGKANLLNWSTTNEINVDRFEVERSKDGREFSKIGISKANGTNQTNTYQYSDAVAPNTPLWGAGGLYYRLKMIDRDGQFSYSPIRQITTNNSPLIISIFPNPAKDVLQVQVESDKKTALQLIVLSADGKVLMSKSITANEGSSLQSINISILPKGSYLLKVKSYKDEQVMKFEKL